MNAGKICGILLLIVGAVFAACLCVSILIGRVAFAGCVWAVLVSGIAVCGSVIPLVYAHLSRVPLSTVTVLAAGAIRLLIMFGGVAIIIFFIKPDILWFTAWTALFYLVILIIEVWVFVRILNRKC